MSASLRFERRRRSVPVPRTMPAANTPATEQEAAELAAVDQQIETAARATDGRFDAFVRFFTVEHRKYGPAVRSGVLAIFWIAHHTRVAPEAETVLESLPDVDRSTAATFVRSFRSGLELTYVTEAVGEFDELERAGRLRERRRDRLAAVRQRSDQPSASRSE